MLGIVGGIGQSLFENIRSFRYLETAAIILIVVASVMIIDMTSTQLRKMLI
jgi:phosphonate transport system permease protein